MTRYGFRFDPIPPLLSSPDITIRLRAAHELEGREVDLTPILAQSSVKKILSKQLPDGSWRYPGKRSGPQTNYEYLETYRRLGELVELGAREQC